jgi:hypothetical protein
MTRLSHEQLLGYLLGALDRQEGLEVEQAVAHDAVLRSELEKLRSSLDTIGLLDEPEDEPPPLCLAARTCEFVEMKAESYGAETVRLSAITEDVVAAANEVGERSATVRPKVKLSPVSRSEVAGQTYRKLDMMMAGSVIVVFFALCLPLLFTNKVQANITLCQNKLRQLGTALHDYSEMEPDGAFPRVLTSGPRGVAGIYALNLIDKQLVQDTKLFLCPGSPKFAAAGGRRIPKLPTLEELDRATGDQLLRYQAEIGGDFGFNMGYFADDEVLPPRNSRRVNYALLADAPSDLKPGRASTHHAGRGQNVLFEDGQVRLVNLDNTLADGTSSESALDDPYHNRAGKVAAGLDIIDAVLGRSNDRPMPELAPW